MRVMKDMMTDGGGSDEWVGSLFISTWKAILCHECYT